MLTTPFPTDTTNLALLVDETIPQSLKEESTQARMLYDKCVALAMNLSWTWSPEVITLFQDIHPVRWRALDHNPIALLAEFTPKQLHERAIELVLQSRIHQAYRRLRELLGRRIVDERQQHFARLRLVE